MDTIKTTAVLFDFDGVVMDTETQYSIFWHKVGVDYLGMDDLESRIKGQTMTYICDTFFAGDVVIGHILFKMIEGGCHQFQRPENGCRLSCPS